MLLCRIIDLLSSKYHEGEMTLRASKLLVSGFLFSLAAFVLPANAHTLWVSPSATQVVVSQDEKRPTYITVDAAASSAVFDPDHVAARVDNAIVVAPDGSTQDVENKFTGKLRSGFDVKLTQEGTYRISLLNDMRFATFKVGTEVKRLRGSSEEELKAQIPADATDVSFSRNVSRIETLVVATKPGELKPLNEGLELYPLQPVSDFVVGEAAKFRVLKDGKALANADVKVIPGGVRYRGELGDETIKSDAKGEISVNWKYAGKYYLNVNFPQMAPRGEGKPDEGGKPNAVAKGKIEMPKIPPVRYGYGVTVEVMPE